VALFRRLPKCRRCRWCRRSLSLHLLSWSRQHWSRHRLLSSRLLSWSRQHWSRHRLLSSRLLS
jgi:hypothetical protein